MFRFLFGCNLILSMFLYNILHSQSVYHTREYVRYLDTANFAPTLEVTVPGPGHIAVWVDYTKPFNMPDTFSFLMKAYLTMVDATGDTQLTMVYIPFTYINKGESPEVTFVRFGGVKRLEVTFDTVLYSLQDTTSIIPWADVPENILVEVMLSDGDCPRGRACADQAGLDGRTRPIDAHAEGKVDTTAVCGVLRAGVDRSGQHRTLGAGDTRPIVAVLFSAPCDAGQGEGTYF
ncbi:MAG: hypothetical protein KatS3mg028_1589 [Bacteroidia bacterium]|nr:MAG: hypothetical protein KatS3mg028_1589 [Bacteroidia bacterium]